MLTKRKESHITRVPVYPTRSRTLINILTMIAAVVGCIVLLEVTYRTVFLSKVTDTPPGDRPQFYYKAEDSPQFRDYAYDVPKPEGTFRIVAVGDSFTFPTLMQFDDAYPKRLERMLNLNNVDTSKNAPSQAEVLNFGMKGFATTHEVKMVRKALKSDADLIILQITLNDLDPEARPLKRRSARFGDKYTFGELEITKETQPVLYYWKSLGFIAQRLHNAETHRSYIQYHLDFAENPKYWGLFEKSIRKMKFLTDRREIPFVAVLFPYLDFPLDTNYPFAPIHEKIATFFKEQGIELLDLREAYRGIPGDRLQIIPTVDAHPNEIAHRIATETIYRWLETRELIPQQFRIVKKYTRRPL